MSFRARLTTFFVLIVVIPMAAMGVLVFGLIDGSASSRADSRAAGVAQAAASLYRSESQAASLDARTVARGLARTSPARLRARAEMLLTRSGLARVDVARAGGARLSVGARSAVAPGIAVVRAAPGRPALTVAVSELTAAAFVNQLAGRGTALVVRSAAATDTATDTLGSSLPAVGDRELPAAHGTVRVAGARYRVVTQRVAGFGGTHFTVSVLSAMSATAGSVRADRMIAAGFILVFLLLAFGFTLFASHGLQSQVSQFLEAARRLGGGDFSSPVPTVGHDEFAALGDEFNQMSEQLRHRLDELEQERARFRASVRRIGEAFASGLDREALLDLALRTAIDAVQADRGRVSARGHGADPLIETGHQGPLAGLQSPLREAERAALEDGGLGVASRGQIHVAAVALGAIEAGGPAHGVISVCREDRPFSDDDLELLRSLADRATLALANVNIHRDVVRQAVTDDLTGLASHGHFQELLDAELAEAERYGYPVAIAMFDIDNFKSVNDTHGHPQGDLVLRRVAELVRENCREADVPARYGGEELALILPHTDLDGAHEIAERVRTTIAGMGVPRLDHRGWLKVTVSGGVAASADGRKQTLVAEADAALYAAKRSGKNRTVRADGTVSARELARTTGARDGE